VVIWYWFKFQGEAWSDHTISGLFQPISGAFIG
jgi:hypothetical protein